MPTISENGNLFTEIVVFTVKPEQQQELVDAIISEVERWVRHRPGFVSSNFHLIDTPRLKSAGILASRGD